MTEENKAEMIVGYMARADQEKNLTKIIKTKKYQVTVELSGKTKYAYCDDLSELDPFIRAMKARIIEVVGLNEN